MSIKTQRVYINRAAQQLNHIIPDNTLEATTVATTTNTLAKKSLVSKTFNDNTNKDIEETQRQQDMLEQDVFYLGKAYFDTREYERAACSLEECMGPLASFLRMYSFYLSGEKRMKEKLLEFKGKNSIKLYIGLL